MAKTPEEVEVRVSWIAAIAKPGDTILVGFNFKMTQQEAHDARKHLMENIPGVEIVVVDQIASITVVSE